MHPVQRAAWPLRLAGDSARGRSSDAAGAGAGRRAAGPGHLYKTGGAASVGRVEVAGRTLVVKRYNIKGFAHWLKRFWRPSRAWHSWQEGNRLAFLGIATPKPLALLEKRFLWLRSRAYLVTEYLAGRTLSSASRPISTAARLQRPSCRRWTGCLPS